MTSDKDKGLWLSGAVYALDRLARDHEAAAHGGEVCACFRLRLLSRVAVYLGLPALTFRAGRDPVEVEAALGHSARGCDHNPPFAHTG